MNSNQNHTLATRWIFVALLYFVLAVCLGVGMAASHDFRLRGLHVHLNLLGWVSAAIMGLIYRLYPQAAATRLARWHFGVYNAALPVMMASLGALLLGEHWVDPIVGASSVAVTAAIVLFALAVWRGGEAGPGRAGPPQAAWIPSGDRREAA